MPFLQLCSSIVITFIFESKQFIVSPTPIVGNDMIVVHYMASAHIQYLDYLITTQNIN